jgi:hypothetical protein
MSHKLGFIITPGATSSEPMDAEGFVTAPNASVSPSIFLDPADNAILKFCTRRETSVRPLWIEATIWQAVKGSLAQSSLGSAPISKLQQVC